MYEDFDNRFTRRKAKRWLYFETAVFLLDILVAIWATWFCFFRVESLNGFAVLVAIAWGWTVVFGKEIISKWRYLKKRKWAVKR